MPPGLTTGRLKEGACFLTSLPRFATGRIQDGVTGRARSARIEGGPGPRARTTTPAGCQHRWIDHCHSTGSVPSSPHPACPPARPDEGVTKRGNRFRSRQPAAPTMTPGFAKLELDSRPSHRRSECHAIHADVLLRRGAVGEIAGIAEGRDHAGVRQALAGNRDERSTPRQREATTELDERNRPCEERKAGRYGWTVCGDQGAARRLSRRRVQGLRRGDLDRGAHPDGSRGWLDRGAPLRPGVREVNNSTTRLDSSLLEERVPS